MRQFTQRWKNPDRELNERDRPGNNVSIATRLRWSYLISSTLPLLLVGAVLLYISWTTQQTRVYTDQHNLAMRISRSITGYVDNMSRQLETFGSTVRPSSTSLAQWRVAAQDLATRNYPDLVGISLIDANGQELLRVANLQLLPENQMRQRGNEPAIDQALHHNQRTLSDIEPSKSDSTLQIFTLTLPLPNDAGVVIGAIEAQIDATPIIDELRLSTGGSNSNAYLISSDGKALVYNSEGNDIAPEISRLIAAPTGASEYLGIRQRVIGAIAPVNLPLGQIEALSGWTVVVEQPSSVGFASVRGQVLVLALLIVLVGSIALLWAFRQAQELLNPLEQLRIGAATVGAGRLDYRIPLQSQDELGEVARTFNQMASHLQQSLAEIENQNERLRHGLALARDIQVGLLPNRAPWNDEALAVYARSIPAYEVGGDFYTYLALPNGRAAVAIGDISGKGVGAALLMALTSSAVESQMRQIEHPAEVLTALNQLLAPRLRANHMNAALLLAVFDPAEQTLRVANAGMIAPAVLTSSGCRFLDVGGLPVGAFPGAVYEELVVRVAPQDVVLLLSDGVVEAHDEQGALFGFERLEQTVDQAQTNGNIQALVERVLTDVHDFMGGMEQHDDITLVAIRMGSGVHAPNVEKEPAVDYAII